MEQLDLLPYPRSVTPGSGTFVAGPGRRIVLDQIDVSTPLLGAVRRLQAALREHAAATWEASAAIAGPESENGVILRLSSERVQDSQGYALRITPERIELEGRAEPGLFYGICTLIQLLQQHGRALPCLEIADWPDFPVRGVMLDISRDKVPRMDTLCELVDMLAAWKINQIQLYTEHTFAYRNHPEVWAAASPLTGDEILELDEYCRQRYVELVPNQNSFGHMHHWLTHPRYAALAEIHGTFQTRLGQMEGPFSLCPIDPGSLDLVGTLYDELLPHFRSRMFNVGCDETLDLGQGRSRDAALIVDEIELTAHMLRHACRCGLLALGTAGGDTAQLKIDLTDDLQEIIAGYKEIWLKRNRIDGLEDSAARLRQALVDYQ